MSNPLRTLRGRLASTYAMLVVIAVATSALYTANTVTSGLHDRVVLDLADEARLVAEQVSGPLARDGVAAVNDYVARAESLTHARLLIARAAGDVVAVTRGWSSTVEDSGNLTEVPAIRVERFSAAYGTFRWCSCMRWRLRSTPFNDAGKDGRVAALADRVDRAEPVGVLAYDDGEAVGWCSIAPKQWTRPRP